MKAKPCDYLLEHALTVLPSVDTLKDEDLELHILMAAARFAGNRKFHSPKYDFKHSGIIMDFAVDYLACLYVYLHRKGHYTRYNPHSCDGYYHESAIGIVQETLGVIRSKGKAKHPFHKALQHLQVLVGSQRWELADCYIAGNYMRLASVNHFCKLKTSPGAGSV